MLKTSPNPNTQHKQGHLLQAHIPPLCNCKDTGEELSSLHNMPNTPMQHGYKTEHSTVMSLHTLNNTVAKGFNQMALHARTITVALNMSKSLNTINIHILIRKLLQTKIPGTIIKLIANYIKGHQPIEITHPHNVNSKLAFHKASSLHQHY